MAVKKETHERWKKENMRQLKVTYKKEFVEEFKAACDKLGLAYSHVFRKAMEETIEKANGKN